MPAHHHHHRRRRTGTAGTVSIAGTVCIPATARTARTGCTVCTADTAGVGCEPGRCFLLRSRPRLTKAVTAPDSDKSLAIQIRSPKMPARLATLEA